MTATVSEGCVVRKVNPGQKFGKWTAIRKEWRGNWKAWWLCRCDCGTERWLPQTNLTRGLSNKCSKCRGDRTRTHGLSDHPMYGTWKGMIDRCSKENHPAFHRYGGRGIRVCERWQSMQAFIDDMGEKPTPSHTIDRINNDGNYEPMNCRWATKKEQRNNQSRRKK